MGIDYLIFIVLLSIFFGILGILSIYAPFKWVNLYLNNIKTYFKKITFNTANKPISIRKEPSLYNAGLKQLNLNSKIEPPPQNYPIQETKNNFTVLYVIAPLQQPYKGYQLWQALIDENLVYGEMQIFHAYTYHNMKREILFSVAGAIEPGYFDSQQVESISVPGLCLFMHNDIKLNPLQTFEGMLKVGFQLTQILGGTLCDEQRKPLSEETIHAYQARLTALSISKDINE